MYFQRQEAGNDANPGDELVYFGTVDEEQEVVIGKNLTIRAAQVGNAADEVKSHADFVTTSVDEEGIQYALKELKII